MSHSVDEEIAGVMVLELINVFGSSIGTLLLTQQIPRPCRNHASLHVHSTTHSTYSIRPTIISHVHVCMYLLIAQVPILQGDNSFFLCMSIVVFVKSHW